MMGASSNSKRVAESLLSEDHCDLCVNRVMDPRQGHICVITMEKRRVNRRCMDFDFREDIISVNRDYQEMFDMPENQIKNAYGTLIKFTVIGLVGICISLFFWNTVADIDFSRHKIRSIEALAAPIALSIGSLIALSLGLGAFIKGKENAKYVSNKRLKHDYLLQLYNFKSKPMRIFLFLLASFSFFACTDTNQEKPKSSPSSQAIDSLMDQWHLDAAQADFDQYMGLMDSISIFIGTDARENWSKEEFMSFSKPYFDRGKAWEFTTMERNVYFSESGEVAWFDELLDTWMGTCRGSGVLERSSENWKLKHYVLSIEIPNENVQAVMLAKHEGDSLFKAQYRVD